MANAAVYDWLRLLASARTNLPPPTRATRYDGPVGVGISQSQRINCGGTAYIVKFRNNPEGPRSLGNEQLVASLGSILVAPIPPVAHIDVPSQLARTIAIANGPAADGIQHGSLEQNDCTDRMGIAYVDEPENRARFASLYVLYTWLIADDHQWIYRKTTPHLVWSVDHSRFLAGGTAWTPATLSAAGGVRPDPQLSAVGFRQAELDPPLTRLSAVSEQDVAVALARVHSDWGVSDDDLGALGSWLMGRARETVALLSARSGP